MSFDKYAGPQTGLEIVAQIGGLFTPRFFCDDSTTVFDTKAPVAKLSLSPKVQFISTNVAWDVSQSASATGTIDTFDLTFGGGGASDLTGQDWSTDPKTGNVQYTSTGVYTVTLYVTDTLSNRSQADKQTAHVIDQVDAVGKIFIATSDGGLYTYVPGGSPATSNTGLSGGNLNFASGVINPHYSHLGTSKAHYWAPTDSGLIYSVDGGGTWTAISAATLGDPTNTAGDGTPPDTDDLDQVCVIFDPQDPKRVYCLRATDSTWNGSNSPRVFLYWSNDYGATWSSVGVGVT